MPHGGGRRAAHLAPPEPTLKRVVHEPAYVLHRYDWSESSVIVEVFSRQYGRVPLVAKGAKRPSSNFRSVLLPLQPLSLAWSGDGEIRTLKSAEWGGGDVMPRGDALLSGYYANELLMRLLPREDAHPRLFDAYAALVHVLASGDAEALAPTALRAFELLLLRESGHLPSLQLETATLAPLDASTTYRLLAEGGLRMAHSGDPGWLTGAVLTRLAAALDSAAPFTSALQTIGALTSDERSHLRRQLRELLHYHCGVQGLRTRQLLVELQSL